jgi:hypothetical protein
MIPSGRNLLPNIVLGAAMTRRSAVFVSACSVLCASAAFAQARTTFSVVPLAGAVVPAGKWVDSSFLQMEPGVGIFVGATGEVSFSKSFSVALEASRTLGALQELEARIDTSGFGDFLTLNTDMSTTTITGSVVFRPLGRTPSGAPKTLYLEAGVGLTRYDVSLGLQSTEPQQDSDQFDFSSTTGIVMAGAGLSFPAGPRATVQVFGRFHYQMSEYSSDFLDDLSQIFGFPIEGEKSIAFQVGLGLRIGR